MNTGKIESSDETIKDKDYYVPYNMDLHIRRFSNKPKLVDLDLNLRMKIYELLEITGEDANRGDLRIFDEDKEESLILIHYLNLHPAVYHVRGIVFDISDNDHPFIVASSFAYTEDIIPSSLRKDFQITEDMYITKTTEGTAMRIFQSKSGKWHIATHKKLRGANSKWSGPTFGEIFDSVWGTQEDHPFSNYLDPELCHIFLLASPENRLVCRIPSPSMTLVGQFRRCENGRMKLSSDLTLLSPHENVEFQIQSVYDTEEELILAAENLNWEEYTGFLIVREDGGVMTCFKLVPQGYARRRAIRGNEPNLTLRYLQLRCEDGDIKTTDMIDLFPEHKNLFDDIEKDLRKLPIHLRTLYFRRYRESGYIRMPGEEYHIVGYVYDNFNSKYNVLENIKQKISNSDARQLNAMIKHMNKPERYYTYNYDE